MKNINKLLCVLLTLVLTLSLAACGGSAAPAAEDPVERPHRGAAEEIFCQRLVHNIASRPLCPYIRAAFYAKFVPNAKKLFLFLWISRESACKKSELILK